MGSPFVLHLLGWTLVAGLDFALNRTAWPSGDPGWAVYEALSLAGLGLAISSALAWIYRRRMPARGARAGAVAAAGALAGSAVWYLLAHALDTAVGNPYAAASLVEGLFGPGMLILFIMLTWHGAFLALRATARAAEAERLAHEARLLALRYQLDPHFLFNALNSAVALIDEDPRRAQSMLTLLSGLLRQTLEGEPSPETTLGRELDLIARYMEIQHIRFDDKLRVDLEVADEARRCAVPPLLVHALVENAVKHGLRTSSVTPVEIRLIASYDGGALRIEVRNMGRITEGGDGLGLRNVADRLNAMYPGRHSFALFERDGAVRATMEIRSPRLLS